MRIEKSIKEVDTSRIGVESVSSGLRNDFDIIKKAIDSIQGDLGLAKKKTPVAQAKPENNVNTIYEMTSQIVR